MKGAINMSIETKCLHLEDEESNCNHYGAISYPIYQTATYAHPEVGKSSGKCICYCKVFADGA